MHAAQVLGSRDSSVDLVLCVPGDWDNRREWWLVDTLYLEHQWLDLEHANDTLLPRQYTTFIE